MLVLCNNVQWQRSTRNCSLNSLPPISAPGESPDSNLSWVCCTPRLVSFLPCCCLRYCLSIQYITVVHAEVEEAVEDKDTGVVVCCQMGGTLEPKESQDGSTLGLQSRSLVAAYQLVKAGYTGVRVLKNGMTAWIEDGHDVFLYDDEE